MNKWLTVIFLFCLSIFTSAFAEHIQTGGLRKIYFQQENVVFQNNQILIGHGNQWMPVSQLFADANGLYITPPQESVSLFQWVCEYCGWEDRCEACDRKR